MDNTFHQIANESRDIPSYDDLIIKLETTIRVAWGIKDKINYHKISQWLENFTGDALLSNSSEKIERTCAMKREKQLALFLLCNFVYYNESEIRNLMKLMFRKYIHCHCISECKQTFTENGLNSLLQETRFSILGDLSESSSYLLYLFRQENHLSKSFFNEEGTFKNVVFIDDFSLTGSQINRYLKKKIKLYGNDKKYYVLLMISSQTAINSLKSNHDITVLPCIVLDECSKAFSEDSIIFKGYNDIYKNEAKMVCEYYGMKLEDQNKPKAPLGFGGCGYIFGTYIPSKIITMLWYFHFHRFV